MFFSQSDEIKSMTSEPFNKNTSNAKSKNNTNNSNKTLSGNAPKAKKCKSMNTNKSDKTISNSTSGPLSGAPKKPINPYLIFCQENRSSVQGKYQQENNVLKCFILC